jgi:hypothetical protein
MGGGAAGRASSGTAGQGTGGRSGPGTGGGGGGQSIRLVIFYTRWGTSYPEWLPTGTERSFTLGPILQPLARYQNQLIVISGLTNANLYMDTAGTVLRGANANDMGDAMISLLTAAPAPIGGPASGPSFDTIVGIRPGAAGPPLRLAVGQFGFDDNPGICFGTDGAALRGEPDPNAVSMRLLGHYNLLPSGDIDSTYPLIGAAHIAVIQEALYRNLTNTAVLMWGDHVVPKWLGLGLTDDVHTLSHLGNNAYTAFSTAMPPVSAANPFRTLQTWCATQFAMLLDSLAAVPIGSGTLLDQSVVIWLSESGAAVDHTGYFMPVVIAGRGGGRLDVGRFIDLKPRPVPANDLTVVTRTQGDLLSALGVLWTIPRFGDPAITRQPLTEILLKP